MGHPVYIYIFARKPLEIHFSENCYLRGLAFIKIFKDYMIFLVEDLCIFGAGKFHFVDLVSSLCNQTKIRVTYINEISIYF